MFKKKSPTTLELITDTTVSIPGNTSTVITPNTKLQICKCLRNIISITNALMIPGIDEKRLLRKHRVKHCTKNEVFH